MKKVAVNQLLSAIGSLVHHSQEYRIKLTAMERMLRNHPELNQDYQEWAWKLRNDRTMKSDHQAIAEALEVLRKALLQD